MKKVEKDETWIKMDKQAELDENWMKKVELGVKKLH